MRSVHGSRALDLAMRLQCLSVVSQGYGTVLTNNIPGMQEYDYRHIGRSDYEAYDRNSRDRPLPGAITHQMDVAAVKYLRKLEKLFVKELASLIFKPKIKPWYELFLTFYIIFWNLEYINKGAKGYMRAKNGTVSTSLLFTPQMLIIHRSLSTKSTTSSAIRSRSGSSPSPFCCITGGARCAATRHSNLRAITRKSYERGGTLMQKGLHTFLKWQRSLTDSVQVGPSAPQKNTS